MRQGWGDGATPAPFFGDVAQLGEHLRGTQKVGGSNPPISTLLDDSMWPSGKASVCKTEIVGSIPAMEFSGL